MSGPARAGTREHSQFRLLAERRFAPFFGVQFLGAFNDNVFKNALVILVAFHGAGFAGLAPEVLVNLAGGLFILPFFLFSATAGQLADKYEKARLIRLVKVLEIAIMVIAAVGFVRHERGAAARGALPPRRALDAVRAGQVRDPAAAAARARAGRRQRAGRDGHVRSRSSLGTIVGGVLIAAPSGPGLLVPAVTIGVAVLGYAVSRRVPAAPPPHPASRSTGTRSPRPGATSSSRARNRTVFLSILGISWFWFFGALLLAQFPAYAKNLLGGDEQCRDAAASPRFSVGIGVGLAAVRAAVGAQGRDRAGAVRLDRADAVRARSVLRHAVDAGGDRGRRRRVPGCARRHWRILVDLVLIGMFGGFYIVPLYALIQSRSDRSHRSRIIAGNNILNALFMVVAALVGVGLARARR